MSFYVCVAGKANAALIVGDLYEDEETAGLYWEYVGSFDLTHGADRLAGEVGKTLNGIDAALLNFNTLSANEIALSSNIESAYADIADFMVNHFAWYDTYYNMVLPGQNGVTAYREDITADINGNDVYDADGDVSAFVWDRAEPGANINHVFKLATTQVPEPSTMAIFCLAFIVLVSRRVKH